MFVLIFLIFLIYIINHTHKHTHMGVTSSKKTEKKIVYVSCSEHSYTLHSTRCHEQVQFWTCLLYVMILNWFVSYFLMFGNFLKANRKKIERVCMKFCLILRKILLKLLWFLEKTPRLKKFLFSSSYCQWTFILGLQSEWR